MKSKARLRRIVNAHDAMVEACRAALDYIVDENPGASEADGWVFGVCDKLRAALKLAEPEGPTCDE